MDDTTAVELPSPDFDALLAGLAKLSRNHLLYFRIEVGRGLSRAFYADDRERYRAGMGNKNSSFRQFVAAKAAELADLGLSERLLRQSLLTFFVVKDLPRAVVAQLVYSHVVQLTAVDDDQTRALLSKATVDNHWTGQMLQNAIDAVRAGRWPDADPAAPGLQGDPAPAAASELEDPDDTLAPGRVVTRFEKTAKDLGSLVGQWERVPVDKLSKEQKRRMGQAITDLEGRISAIKARFGG
jgi:hypothetical protein